MNFLFVESFFNYFSFSGNLLATEAYLLLVFCMLFYLGELKDKDENLFNSPHFWVVTGLSIYVVVNFFVFLFYLPMIDVDVDLVVRMWDVHNISFIIFCLFLTKAFYGPFRNQYSV
jgi:FtsH-binding integral membrane protein